MSVTKEICEWLNTKAAKENLDLSTERDIFKAECDRLGSGYDAAQSELDALREDLENRTDRVAELAQQRNDLQQRLTAAEQRNAELTKAIADAEYRADQGKVWNGMGWTYTGLHSHGQQKVLDILRAALKRTESGASE